MVVGESKTSSIPTQTLFPHTVLGLAGYNGTTSNNIHKGILLDVFLINKLGHYNPTTIRHCPRTVS